MATSEAMKLASDPWWGSPSTLGRAAARRARSGCRRASTPLQCPEVVEVGVADEHDVGSLDVGRAQPDRRRGGNAVEVAVEEYDEVADGQPERRHPQPVEPDVHVGEAS